MFILYVTISFNMNYHNNLLNDITELPRQGSQSPAEPNTRASFLQKQATHKHAHSYTRVHTANTNTHTH